MPIGQTKQPQHTTYTNSKNSTTKTNMQSAEMNSREHNVSGLFYDPTLSVTSVTKKYNTNLQVIKIWESKVILSQNG